MTKKDHAARWFDQADFDSTHDGIFANLLDHWRRIVPAYKGHVPYPIVHGEIMGEPALDGYPPVFPDAIAHGWYAADHRDSKVGVRFNHYANKHQAYCRACCPDGGSVGDTRDISADELEAILGAPEPRRGYVSPHVDGWQEKDAVLLEEYKVAAAHYQHLLSSRLPQWATDQRWGVECTAKRFHVVFEIKPKIDSLGSVMRQLNLYGQRAKATHVVLIPSDSRFNRQFTEQGYYVSDPRELVPDEAEAGAGELVGASSTGDAA
jgi:hypothetical protein